LSVTGSSALAHANGSRRPIVPAGTSGAASAPYHVLAALPTAAPANDDWASATAISGASGTASGTNVAATTQAGKLITPRVADSITATGRTVWWKWTAPASGNYVFDTAASALEDTVLAGYTGSSVGALTQVAGSDDTDSVRTSRVAFDAVSAGVYYIQVGSYNGRDGGRDRARLARQPGRQRRLRPSHDDLRRERLDQQHERRRHPRPRRAQREQRAR
jgi:hypothetical protein